MWMLGLLEVYGQHILADVQEKGGPLASSCFNPHCSLYPGYQDAHLHMLESEICPPVLLLASTRHVL